MELNAAGDLVVDSPEALAALVEPGTLDLLDRLRRGEAVDAPPARFEQLERLGFVTRDGDRWAAVGRGIYFEIPVEGPGQGVARELTTLVLLREADRPRRWADEFEPELTVDWARAAGMFNARIDMTADELRAVQEELERIMEPYTARAEAPRGAAPVRLLAYFLPEPRP